MNSITRLLSYMSTCVLAYFFAPNFFIKISRSVG